MLQKIIFDAIIILSLLIDHKRGFEMKFIGASELVTLFDEGVLAGVTAAKYPMGNGWMLIFSGDREQYAMRTQRSKMAREFKTLDAAQQAAEQIGFKNMRITWG